MIHWWILIKKQYKVIFFFSFILTAIFSFFIPNFFIINLKIQNVNVELNFDEESAFYYIQDQLDIGFRIPGTEERINCTNYFISKFKELDYNFTYILHNFTILSIECQNVLFKLNENYSNIVILGAHYDTRAKATKDSTNPDDPVPGANDGASGCAALIELARVFYEQKDNLSCQIWFLFFDAEDQGRDVAYGIDGWDWCEGSEKFVDGIDSFYNSENETFECMILLDMVGGVNLKFINEQYSTSSLLDELFGVGRNLGFTEEFPKNAISRYITDDHKAFVNIGIPAADLIINFWYNPDWPYHHTIQDDISHISNHSLEVTGKTIEQFIYNNYFVNLSNIYKGNYPWREDINIPQIEIEMISILIMTIAILGAIVVVFSLFKKDKFN